MTKTYDIHRDGKRLSPISIISGFIRQVPTFALMIYFAFFRASGFDYMNLFLVLFVGLFSFPSIFLRYYYFKYLITPNEIIVYSGVFSKKQRTIPIKKIQNINIQQSFINRILGLSRVQFETAGDAGAEGIFDSVKTSVAEQIKDQIKQYQFGLDEEEDLPNRETGDERFETSFEKQNESNTIQENNLVKMSIKDVATYGFLRFRPILLVVFGWSMGMLQQFMPEEFSNLEYYVDRDISPLLNALDDFYLYLYLAGFILIAFVISWLADVVLTILQYYDFTLTKGSGKLYTDYGLISKRSNTIPLKKLQMLTLKTNWIRGKLKYWGLTLETAGAGISQNKFPETIIPFASWDKVIEIARGVLNFNLPDRFQNISSIAIRRIFIRYIIFLAVLAIGLSFFISNWYWIFLSIPLFFYLSYLRWMARGYHIDGDRLMIKEGWYYKRIKILKISKIQNLIVRSNIFQRNLGLATLIVDTAASNGLSDATIPDIEIETALKIQDQLLNEFHKHS